MNDLLLSFHLASTSGKGRFFIRATNGEDVFQVEIDPNAGTYRILQNEKEIARKEFRAAGDVEGLAVVVSLIDQQFLFALGGQTAFCLPIDAAAPPGKPTSRPFALGARI